MIIQITYTRHDHTNYTKRGIIMQITQRHDHANYIQEAQSYKFKQEA
jgi:hypothetical protein